MPEDNLQTKNQCRTTVTEILSEAAPELCLRENNQLGLIKQVKRVGRPNTGRSSSWGNINRPRPIIVTLSDANVTADILKTGNKNLKRKLSNDARLKEVRLVDDVSPYTQQRRKQLIPKMNELRRDGLIALIPFTKTAKLIYKQGQRWNTIFPEEATQEPTQEDH